MKNFLGFVFIFIPIIISACAFEEMYPENEWGTLHLPPSNKCIHFEGQYSNWGQSQKNIDWFPLLAWVFFSKEDEVNLELVNKVGLSFPTDEVLKATIFIGNEPVFSREIYQQIDFVCENGRLIIFKDSRFASTAGVPIMWDDRKYTFNISKEHLIVKSEVISAGIAIIFPVIGGTTNWYRFRRFDPNEEHESKIKRECLGSSDCPLGYICKKFKCQPKYVIPFQRIGDK